MTGSFGTYIAGLISGIIISGSGIMLYLLTDWM